jgi:leucyl aminopeptidase
MKITFLKSGIETAPKGYLHIRFTEEAKGTKRFVREGEAEWLELGTGKRSEVTLRKFIIICRSVVQAAKQQKAKRIAVQFDQSPFPQLNALPLQELASVMAQNFVMANFEFTTFKTRPKEGWNDVEEILVCGDTPKEMRAGFTRGQVLGETINECRELSNTPGGSMTPKGLAKAAKTAVTGLPVTVTTLNRAALTKLGMGLLAGVGAGSTEEPTFTVMTYNGGKPAEKPIVLAGKGITFDSGGLNIKPSSSIYEMHLDMSGGAAVIHAVALAAKLKLKKNVVALIPAAENMLGNGATRPGDIHRSLSGKTVEVTDTDAEGRLVLADAITYAKRLKPGVVIDVATLTGAAVVALGHHASGLMTRDNTLAKQLLALGEESGDYLWRLPLWDEYESVVKSEFADMQNHSISGGRYGGATNGAMFLWQFAKELDCPWAHIDIAPRMTAAPGEELAKGAAGAPVRLLVSFIEQWNPNAKK